MIREPLLLKMIAKMSVQDGTEHQKYNLHKVDNNKKHRDTENQL